MIDIIPAIDLIDGKCVRLTKGDFNTKKVYSSDPVEMAAKFEDHGFKRLHLVDLDGANKGRLKHLKILEKIALKTSLETDFGGGVTSLSDVRSIINAGAFMVCVGSMAVKKEDEFDEVLNQFGPDKILLAADTKDDKLVISGWKESSGLDIFDFLEKMTNKDIKKVLCTDVNRDGMLEGTSIPLYKKIMKGFPDLYLIASGGVSGSGDIDMLDEAAIPAVVFGKAFYEGKLKIEDIKHYL
ncbi:MAG: 1-(5-phosphoribosyl)-5-[(5-phosphoribosylamino)methylideneamino]imidazole-4-carboxamide isomerase [Bacteroidales bacterium]